MPGSAGCVPVPAGTPVDNASMERRVSNASDVSLQESPRQGLSTQESVEFIPTRSSKVTPPKPAANPLQFIKVGPCDLYKSAQEQIKKVEEVKKIKAEVRDEAEDWQSNLDNWKCGRRKRQEHIIERVVEVKKLELEEHDRNRRRSKTFNEMMEERNSRGRKASLMVYNDDEANDLSDLGIGTSSGDDNQSLSDQSNNGNQGDEASEEYTYKRPNETHDTGLPEASEEYTYDRAIQNYVNFTETRVKARNNINEDTNGHTEAIGKTPPQLPFKVRRESSPKIGEKIAFLDEKRRSSTDLSNADKNIKLAKVDVLKRRELFEKPENDDAKSPSKVNVNNSQSIKERLSHLEKHGEQIESKSVNRASSEISGSIKDRLTSLERQKSTEKLNGKEVVMKKRLSNGDCSSPQSVKERLSSLQKQGSTEDKIKSSVNKVPVEVSIKERVSNLDQSAAKEVKKVTPERDPGFSSKLANLQQSEAEPVFSGKPVAGSERSSSPEDEIFATKRTQFHRSLDSLDVEDDLTNGVFERVQSLEDIECLGRRHYPPSASSIEMLVFSSQSGDTDREDSGIHTADVSSSVSQADEPIEDVELVTNGEGFLEGEVVNHRRQLSELSEQLSPLPPIQEMETFETTSMFINVEESQEKSHSDDVSHGLAETSIIVGEGNEDLTVSSQSAKEGVVHRGLSPLVVVEIDINEPVPLQPLQRGESETPRVQSENPEPIATPNSPMVSNPIPDLEIKPQLPAVIQGNIPDKVARILTKVESNQASNEPLKSEPNLLKHVALGTTPVTSESETNKSQIFVSDSKSSKIKIEITPTPIELHAEVPIKVETIQTPVSEPIINQPTNNEPKIILVSLKKGNTELLPEKPKKLISSPTSNVTVSGVLKLELSMESILKEKNTPSKSVSPDPSVLENVAPVVVSFNPKPAPRSVKTFVKDKISSLKVRMSSDVPAKDVVVSGNVCANDVPVMSNTEKRRTVVEVCEKVDVLMPSESRSPLPTPFISLQHGKEPLEAVIASRNVVPDTMMLAARETAASPGLEETKPVVLDKADHIELIEDVVDDVEVVSKEIEQNLIIEKNTFLDMSAFSNAYGIEETLAHNISTSEIPPLNLLSDMELLSNGVSFPLGPPTSAEPPKEKPPPPPTELSDEESSKPKTSLRRIDSTKRIKKEIRRKRSDFLGIEGTTDDSYLEPVLSVAPDMTAFLIEEQRQQKQLYRQSICSESDSNPGESRDSGVELERGHVDDHWLGKQILTPDTSAQHSRQESEIYGNGSSITSEEDEITKKEREIIEILEKEEQWRYANNSSSQDDIGEKLAEKLRQLEQEKLQLEWERAEEERRRIAEENLRREDAMRLQAKEQDLKHQETNHITDVIADTNGDGSNVVEVIRAERERLQHEQEELVNQRENLIMRETQQLQRNMKQWDNIPSSAMSLQDITRPQNSYQSNGMPPIVPPAPLNYRLSLPDLQDQVAPVPRQTHRAPPPIPPAKPTRSQAQRDRDNSIRNSRTPSAEVIQESAPLRQAPQTDGVQLRNYQPTEAVQMRHSNGHASQQPQPVNGNTSQQMTRQTLQALSAAPRSRIVSTDNWIQAKKKPEAQRNSAAPNYNYQHWLIQEAEHRRITEQQQRNAVTTSPRKAVPNVPQTREKPLPDAIIQTLTQRVQNRAAGFADTKTSPVRRETQHISRSSPPKNPAIGNVHQNQSLHNVGPVSNGAMNNQMSNQMNGQAKSQMNVPMHVQTTSIDSQEKMLSVSGKKKCSHCTDELGRGAAMIIESLRLFYHIDCFKCCVCHVQLGDGLMGTDVRVRNNKLHCHNCYSSDDGVKFSCV